MGRKEIEFHRFKFNYILLFLSLFIFSCSNESSDNNASVDTTSLAFDSGESIVTHSAGNSTVGDTIESTDTSMAMPPGMRLKFNRGKFNNLYKQPDFFKFKFFPQGSGTSLTFYTCALDESDNLIGNCLVITTGNDRAPSTPPPPIDTPGWALTKTDIMASIDGRSPTKNIFFTKVMRIGKGSASASAYRDYQVDIGSASTGLYLDPSPPGILPPGQQKN